MLGLIHSAWAQPVIITPPQNQTAVAGATTTFTVVATGADDPDLTNNRTQLLRLSPAAVLPALQIRPGTEALGIGWAGRLGGYGLESAPVLGPNRAWNPVLMPCLKNAIPCGSRREEAHDSGPKP